MKSFTVDVTLFLKLTVNVLSIFVAFLENMNFNLKLHLNDPALQEIFLNCAKSMTHEWNEYI